MNASINDASTRSRTFPGLSPPEGVKSTLIAPEYLLVAVRLREQRKISVLAPIDPIVRPAVPTRMLGNELVEKVLRSGAAFFGTDHLGHAPSVLRRRATVQ